MKVQVFRIQCCEKTCINTIGCYVSNRNPQRIECLSCEAMHCPMPTGPESHGVCSKCLSVAMKKDEELQMIGLS